MKKKKKVAIVFNAGLGDGLQMIPLWKALKNKGYIVTLFLGSAYFPIDFAKSLNCFDEIIEIQKNEPLFKTILKFIFYFDKTFIDYYSSGPKQSLFACLISKKVIVNRNKWYLRLLPNLTYKTPIENGHNIFQNLHLANLANQEITNTNYNIEFNLSQANNPEIEKYLNGETYIAVQISAANNQADYKNWGFEKWGWLFQKILKEFPALLILLIGDENEADLCQQINNTDKNRVVSLAGKTNLNDLALLLKKAKMYLGLDSGPMHLSAMLGTPTLTLWGPSDPKTIGYEIIDPQFHRDICLWVECHPCLSFIRPNTSLVNHPSKCPFPRCIKEIKEEEVWLAFQSHWNNIYPPGLSK